MKTRDMTNGNLFGGIIGFAIPVCLGLLFQQLYNLVDTVVVGKLLGVNALAGVGSTTGLTFFSFSISTGLGNGCAVSISQRFGAGDIKGVRRYFGNSIVLCGILSFVLTACTVVIIDPVLKHTKTPDEIYGFAHDYVIIILAGMICTVYYNLLAAALRAIGDSRTPVLALVIASVINIIFDIMAIGAFHMGVAGAALATVVSQLLSAIFLLLSIMKKSNPLRFSARDLKLSIEVSKEQLKSSLPMALQGAVIALGILIVQSAINLMGTVYVAGCTAGNKLYGIMAAPIEAICQAMIPVSGQNYGAKKYHRINEGLEKVLIMGWILTVLLGIIAWFFGPSFMRLFIDDSKAQVISYGHQFMLYYVLGYGFLTIQMGVCYTLQGSGFAGMTILSGVLETAGRIFGAVVLTKVFGFVGICLALPLAWIFTSVYLLPTYIRCRKKMIKDEKIIIKNLSLQEVST